jgi:hypothetical protein
MNREEKTAHDLAGLIEKLTNEWAENWTSDNESPNARPSLAHLNDLCHHRHGLGGYLSWAMILYGCAWHNFFNGRISEDDFKKIRENFEPIVNELIETQTLH